MSKSQIRPTSEHSHPPNIFSARPREILIQVAVALAMFAVGVLLTGCELIRVGS